MQVSPKIVTVDLSGAIRRKHSPGKTTLSRHVYENSGNGNRSHLDFSFSK